MGQPDSTARSCWARDDGFSVSRHQLDAAVGVVGDQSAARPCRRHRVTCKQPQAASVEVDTVDRAHPVDVVRERNRSAVGGPGGRGLTTGGVLKSRRSLPLASTRTMFPEETYAIFLASGAQARSNQSHSPGGSLQLRICVSVCVRMSITCSPLYGFAKAKEVTESARRSPLAVHAMLSVSPHHFPCRGQRMNGWSLASTPSRDTPYQPSLEPAAGLARIAIAPLCAIAEETAGGPAAVVGDPRPASRVATAVASKSANSRIVRLRMRRARARRRASAITASRTPLGTLDTVME